MSTIINIPLYGNFAYIVGKKPVAVLIEGERIPAAKWTSVYKTILQNCVQDPIYHERLMNLRDKALGKIRTFISGKPDGMTRPVKICEGLYGETQYGSQTLMHILTTRLLVPINYDLSRIKVVVKYEHSCNQ